MTEFALILPFFLLLIVGIIQFGIGIHYWLDLTHTANQGARYATVNLSSVCADPPPNPCGGVSFNTFLRNELDTAVLRNTNTVVTYCFREKPGETDGPTRGDSITVQMERNYNWARIVNIFPVKLVGKASMRLEQAPTQLDTIAGFPTNITACP